jgi:hypothetical protein
MVSNHECRTKRLARVIIRRRHLDQIFKGEVSINWPDDCKIREVIIEYRWDAFTLICESDQFPEVREGHEIPIFDGFEITPIDKEVP